MPHANLMSRSLSETPQGRSAADHAGASSSWHMDSPRMVAQGQRLSAVFGSAFPGTPQPVVQRVSTQIDDQPIDLATADPAALQQLMDDLVARNDAAQLQTLFASLVVASDHQKLRESPWDSERARVIDELLQRFEQLPVPEQVAPPQDPAPPITGFGIRDLFQDRLRDAMRLLQDTWQLRSLEDVFRAALTPITEAYERFTAESPHREHFPEASQIVSEGFIESTYEALLKNPHIESSDLEEHLVGFREASAHVRQGRTEEAFIADQHQRTRIKAAGTWAEAARAFFDIRSRLDALLHRPEGQEDDAADAGRDATGRLAYRLMTGSGQDLFTGLTGGTDVKEGEQTRSGIKRLSLDLADIFSSAACHKDAEQIMRLMAGRLLMKGSAQLDLLEGDVFKNILMSAVANTPEGIKVLKLTTPNQHSVVFLIAGEDDIVRYHTVAGQDSRQIVYNDLLHYEQSLTGLEAQLAAGIERASALSQVGYVTLQWELSMATDMDTMSTRLDTHLGESATALGMGLLVDGLESRKNRALRDPGGQDGDTPSTLDTGAVARIPFREIDAQDHAKVHPLDAETVLDTSQLAPTSYRIVYRGRWMKGVYQGECQDVPGYMRPCAGFLIEDIGPSHAAVNQSASMLPAEETQESTSRIRKMTVLEFVRLFEPRPSHRDKLEGLQFTHLKERWVCKVTHDPGPEAGAGRTLELEVQKRDDHV